MNANTKSSIQWQKNNPIKNKIAFITRNNIDSVQIIYECRCTHDKKILHHFDYAEPLKVIKLCPQCHSAEHKRLRDTNSEYNRTSIDVETNPPKIFNVKNKKVPVNIAFKKQSQRSLLYRITKTVKALIERHLLESGFLVKELADINGVYISRISEILNHDKTDIPVGRPLLARLLNNSIFTLEELSDMAELNENEIDFISQLMVKYKT